MTEAAAILPWQLFGYGVIGGVLPELYYLYSKRKNSKLPSYYKTWLYWGTTLPMVALGGGVALLYGQHIPVNAYLAIHLGVATPVLLNQMIASEPLVN